MQEIQNGQASTNDLQQLPPGATPVDMEELLAAMGELYLQVRMQRKLILSLQQTSTKPSDSS